MNSFSKIRSFVVRLEKKEVAVMISRNCMRNEGNVIPKENVSPYIMLMLRIIGKQIRFCENVKKVAANNEKIRHNIVSKLKQL